LGDANPNLTTRVLKYLQTNLTLSKFTQWKGFNGRTLRQFIRDFGVLEQLTSDGASKNRTLDRIHAKC
jgi:hypothetical protein